MFQNSQFDVGLERIGGRFCGTPSYDNTVDFWLRSRISHLIKILVIEEEGPEGEGLFDTHESVTGI